MSSNDNKRSNSWSRVRVSEGEAAQDPRYCTSCANKCAWLGCAGIFRHFWGSVSYQQTVKQWTYRELCSFSQQLWPFPVWGLWTHSWGTFSGICSAPWQTCSAPWPAGSEACSGAAASTHSGQRGETPCSLQTVAGMTRGRGSFVLETQTSAEQVGYQLSPCSVIVSSTHTQWIRSFL